MLPLTSIRSQNPYHYALTPSRVRETLAATHRKRRHELARASVVSVVWLASNPEA